VEEEKLQMDAHDVDVLFQMCILLYADDTVLFAESPTSLQSAIDAMHEYCLKWDLRINVSKTKVMIFSRGKVRKPPDFYYDNQKLEVTHDFQYLGIKFNYNGSFKPAQKHLYERASRAMFSLLRKKQEI
jgi:hypothetical protein